MSVWTCDQDVMGSFTDRDRDVCHVPESVRRTSGTARGGRDLRVQQIERKDGRRSWTIVWPEGTLHTEADRFLREHEGSGTQKTYAYYLVGLGQVHSSVACLFDRVCR